MPTRSWNGKTFEKQFFLSNFGVSDRWDLSTGVNFNPRDTQYMNAYPDGVSIGRVKIFYLPPLRIRDLRLELK
jgi:hypothetical protein